VVVVVVDLVMVHQLGILLVVVAEHTLESMVLRLVVVVMVVLVVDISKELQLALVVVVVVAELVVMLTVQILLTVIITQVHLAARAVVAPVRDKLLQQVVVPAPAVDIHQDQVVVVVVVGGPLHQISVGKLAVLVEAVLEYSVLQVVVDRAEQQRQQLVQQQQVILATVELVHYMVVAVAEVQLTTAVV